jgi:hypothetical protein
MPELKPAATITASKTPTNSSGTAREYCLAFFDASPGKPGSAGFFSNIILFFPFLGPGKSGKSCGAAA